LIAKVARPAEQGSPDTAAKTRGVGDVVGHSRKLSGTRDRGHPVPRILITS
jgi:hypothetical protein